MSLTRYEFELLTYVERKGKAEISLRLLGDELCISGTTVLNSINRLCDDGLLNKDIRQLSVTEKGLQALEPYRVKRAIILAAGFGSRMMPATKDRPKPMVTVNGVRIIDTLLDALVRVGIKDILIVGGYQKEKLRELLQKYPFLRFVDNPEYDCTNNISSAVLSASDLYDGSYFCEADLYITNPDVIRKYQYQSNILGSYSLETDDWSFKMSDGFLTDYRKGNTYCYNYYGISYWTPEDCDKLREDFLSVYNEPDGKDYFWEFIPFVLKKERYKVEIRPCKKQDIMEIDNYYELAGLDPSYEIVDEGEGL
ncbi:MAG: NTP transferase domain-containing protein [Lachnospiraceae bacterium]|nr:NTP transferase domain-containing protein [Lachnospiraceae bacterium]